jgi:flagellar motor switch protein FliN/FliY
MSDNENQAVAGGEGMETPNPPLKESARIDTGITLDPNKLGILNDVSVNITIEIGRAQIKIRDLLNLSKDSIIDLNKLAGDPVDVYANGKLISKGNIITANGKYCVRLLSVPET